MSNIEASKFDLYVENPDVRHVDIELIEDTSSLAGIAFVDDGICRAYNLAGMLVSSGTSEKECIKALTPGIYILKAGSQVKKFVVK